MKKIALYLSMFFTIIGLVFSSADVQAQEIENVESVSEDAELVPDHSYDDIWRVTVGLKHMGQVSERSYLPYLSFKLGFYGKVADFYQTGVEVDVGYQFRKPGYVKGIPVEIYWMHVLRFLQVDFFELSQRLGVGYFGIGPYGSNSNDDCGWIHLMSWLIGYEFSFRLTDLISLSLNIDYTLIHGFEDSGVIHHIHAGVQVGFHF